MTEKDYLILTDSIEEFKRAEAAYSEFQKHYRLDTSKLHGRIILHVNELLGKSGIGPKNGSVHMTPQYKHGEIKGLELKSIDSEGKIMKSDSDGWLIYIGDWSYLISKKRSENL